MTKPWREPFWLLKFLSQQHKHKRPFRAFVHGSGAATAAVPKSAMTSVGARLESASTLEEKLAVAVAVMAEMSEKLEEQQEEIRRVQSRNTPVSPQHKRKREPWSKQRGLENIFVFEGTESHFETFKTR